MVKLLEKAYLVSGEDHLEELDLSGLPAGLYFIQLKYDDKVMVKKVVKN